MVGGKAKPLQAHLWSVVLGYIKNSLNYEFIVALTVDFLIELKESR